MGIDPGELTIRELMWMFEGRLDTVDRMAWNHTSSMIAKLHNVNCTKQKDMIQPQNVNPYAKRDKVVAAPMDDNAKATLKQVFDRGKKR